MGAHKNNPIAQLHAAPLTPNYMFGAGLESMVIPNEETAAEIQRMLEAEVAAGRDPRLLKIDITNEQKDFAVVLGLRAAKESLVTLRPEQIPWVTWKGPIIFRCPLVDMIGKYEQHMAGEREKLG